MRKLPILFLCILLLSSCIEELVYDKVQPEQVKDSKRFKSKFRGKYYSDGGCYTFEVKKKEIIGSLRIESMIHKDDMPQFKLDIKTDGNEKLDYKLIEKGDSILVKGEYSETIFAIGDKQKLRYYDGVYFLNYRDTSEFASIHKLWHVKLLTLKNDNLILGHLPAEEDYLKGIENIMSLSPITDNDDETIGYKAAPTKENWSRFIREKAYAIEKSYIKKKIKNSCKDFVLDF